MDVKWIILAAGRTHGVNAWCDAVRATGRTAKTMSFVPVARDEGFADDDCVVVNGTAADIATLAIARPWRPLRFGLAEAFACRTFLTAWGTHALQQHYLFLTIGEIARDRDELIARFGVDGRVFVRPDAHDKSFDGGLFDARSLASWHSQLALGIGDVGRLCLVATPRTIDAEWRIFVRGGRVVTGSSYLVRGRIDHASPPDVEVIDFVESIARNPYPSLPDVYALDVCRTAGQLRVVEVGSACSSAPYASDLPALVAAISDAALELYQ